MAESSLNIESSDSGGLKRKGSWKRFKETVRDTVSNLVGNAPTPQQDPMDQGKITEKFSFTLAQLKQEYLDIILLTTWSRSESSQRRQFIN